MATSDFLRVCAERCGGVRSIRLARATDIETITFDPAARAWSAVTLRPGCSFARYDFREDSARYTENARWESGARAVEHLLTLQIDPLDASLVAVEALARGSRAGGWVTVVEMRSGERFLVGYSERFGTEQSLKLHQAASDSGAKPADPPGRKLTLRAVDHCHAMPFAGEIS